MITAKLYIYLTEPPQKISDVRCLNLGGDAHYILCQHDVKKTKNLLDTGSASL